MINPEDEILVDIRTSCTKDEAVAKLLGWMQGHIRQKYVRVTLHGVSEDQLPYLHSLDRPLQEQLLELREAARHQLIEAAESDATFMEMQAKENAVIKADDQINQAATYLLDIDDEIRRGEESELIIDRQATESTGSAHITIRSLDKWAREKYGKQILGSSSSGMSSAAKAATVTKTPPKRQKLRAQEDAILEKIRQLQHQPDALPKNESGKLGIKSAVRAELNNNPLFSGSTVFDKAWERLRGFGQIKDSP
ncbi:MAG: hypothetical protein Q7T94_10065 [Rugosibacter sp.]|nr:hypothetical protein [Rugosibacter sp.]